MSTSFFFNKPSLSLSPKTLIPNLHTEMAPKQKRPSPLDDPPSASSSSDSDEDQRQHIISRQQQHQQQDDDDDEEEEEEQASSEEQEEEDDDDEEDEEEEQQVEPSPAVQPPSKNPPSNSNPRPSSSESATESDSASDSEPDPPVTNSKVKPLASKPIDQTPKPKPKPNTSAAAPPPKSASKRPAESNGHVSDPKRPKKKATETTAASSDEETEEDQKKSGDDSKKLFQRVFSEDDEIAILKGMVEFTSKMGSDPLKHAEAFHDFMKKSLRVDASSNQLKQKIRRLKKKFETNAGKGGKNGEGPSFSKPHDQKAFELSKKVWGNAAEGATNNGVVEKEKENAKANGKARKSPKKENASKREPKPEPKAEQKPEVEVSLVDSEEPGKVGEKGDALLALSAMIRFDKVVGMSALGEDVVKERVEGIEASKRAELEEKWRELQDAELELYVKRAELIAEQARLMLQAHRSSKN